MLVTYRRVSFNNRVYPNSQMRIVWVSWWETFPNQKTDVSRFPVCTRLPPCEATTPYHGLTWHVNYRISYKSRLRVF
jgi:hypothetical protein